jgi:hypothetical protein
MPQPILRTIEGNVSSGAVSGSIVKSYDEPEVIAVPPSNGLLRPLEGEPRPVTGSITTK